MERTTPNPAVRLVVYKRIVAGDLSKFAASSNLAPTGGGARDLRFSPAKEFLPVFRRMFRQDPDGRLRGFFSWADHAPTAVVIDTPNPSRSNEARITKIHECFPEAVVPRDAMDCVLLIVQDETRGVYPYFTSLRSLREDAWHPAFRDAIVRGLTAPRGAKRTAMGYVDIENGRSYDNGRA